MTVVKLPYLWLTAGQYLWKPRSESKDRHPSAQAPGGCRMRALTAHIGSALLAGVSEVRRESLNPAFTRRGGSIGVGGLKHAVVVVTAQQVLVIRQA